MSTTRKYATLPMGLALTAWLIAGCTAEEGDAGEASAGGGGQPIQAAPGEAATDVPDPCTLLTEDQAGLVVGAPVRIGDSETPAGGRGLECEYVGPKAGVIQVEQSILVRAATDDGVRLGDQADVKGLEEATINETLHVLTWHPNGLTIEVQIIAHDGSTDARANLEALAGQVDAALE